MSNCKTGDIAVVTWDEAPVLSNIGKLVRVGELFYVDENGEMFWLTDPVNYDDEYFFVDGADGDKVKLQQPNDNDIYHPDAWLMPFLTKDDFSEEVFQNIVGQMADGKRNHVPAGKRVVREEEVEVIG